MLQKSFKFIRIKKSFIQDLCKSRVSFAKKFLGILRKSLFRMSSSDNSSSDIEEISTTPSSAEALKRCKEFAHVTGTDTALAMFYLQDLNWNLNMAIEKYLDSTSKSDGKVVAMIDVDKLEQDEQASFKSKRFKLLSWNIDGLDGKSIEYRIDGVIRTIKKEQPDVIFLQEVVDYTWCVLNEELSSKYYLISSDKTTPYFVIILVRKDTCEISDEHEVIPFTNTRMYRNLLKVKLKYEKKVNIIAMTSHLESTSEFTRPRMEQLKQCFDEMIKQDPNSVVLFGGDLNMRDRELEAIGGLAQNIRDLWSCTGARKECLYTWDCVRNNNLSINYGSKTPRCRFDRLYFRDLNDAHQNNNQQYTLLPVYFELEGLEKLKSCNRFCSDHWAIQCYFDCVSH